MWEYFIGLLALLRALTGIRFFLIKRRVKGTVKIFEGAEPFFRKVHGKKVAILIHGFTSSPREFKDLSKYLASKGISSYAPLLPGHGTTPERLVVIKYYQWIEAVQEHIKMISKEYEEIYLVGSSFGGNLALLCSNYSTKIKGIITLGTPVTFRKHKMGKYFVLPLLKRIKLFQKKPKSSRDFIDKHKGSYKVVPLRAAYEMFKVLELSKKELSKVTKPILALHVENDSVVSEESHHHILNNVMSKKKEEFKVPASNHVFILGKYAHLANKRVADFIIST